MGRILSINERKNLLHRHRRERNSRVRDRIKAVLAYDDGYSYSEISRILLLDDETIRRHVSDYLEKQKVDIESGGSKGHLSTRQAVELVSHLHEHTYHYVKDICNYLRKKYKVSYTISGMTKWLHAYGFRYKKPNAVPAKANKEAQKKFMGYYKTLKKNTKNKEPIYFIDSVHPQHQTRLAYGWIKKGERKNIGTTAKQFRLNFMGGINLDTHDFVYEQSEKVNELSIQSFLYKLRKKHPGKYLVHLIWDNAGYHCSKKVQEFAKELGFKLHYLPAYSPNLNPIERLWKIMHEQVTYNRYYEKFSDFTEAICHFFKHIGKKKKLLRTRVTDNFQSIEVPNFAF